MQMLAGQLAQRGWEVIFGIAWGRKFNDPKNVEYLTKGYKTYLMDARTGTEEGRVHSIVDTIKRAKPDVVLVNNLISAFEAVKRARKNDNQFYFIASNSGTVPEQTECLLKNMSVLDRVICVSKRTSDIMQQYAKGKVIHIPNGVPVSDHALSHKSRSAIGYAGRLTLDKKVDDLLEYWKKVRGIKKDLKLYVAGSGSLEKDFQELAKEDPNVRFLGCLTRDELYGNFYPNIDIFVHFSEAEGFGLSICEAMMHGCVPVVSQFKGMKETKLLLPTENCQSFSIGDIDSAVKRTEELIENEELYQKLSAAAKSHVQVNFSDETVGKKWKEMLERCFEAPPVEEDQKNMRIGKKEKYKEALRKILRRRVPHATAREEWLHWENSKDLDRKRLKEIKEAFSK